jgi:hypothetical protein
MATLFETESDSDFADISRLMSHKTQRPRFVRRAASAFPLRNRRQRL